MSIMSVQYRVDGDIAVLTMQNPPVNALSQSLRAGLVEGLSKLAEDDSVKAAVLIGDGRGFCAGADISMLEEVTPEFKYAFCLHANETLLRLEHTPKLVIAALGGHCVGGGLEVALGCDLRVARRGSGKCGLPEVALGVLPGTGGTQRLARVLGKSRAIRAMASGELFDYERALELGLVDELFDAEDDASFTAEVLAFARSFCTPGKAALAVGNIKRAVQSGLEVSLESGLALERELQAKLFSSADAKEGISAFVEKRDATFRGQ